MLDALQGRSVLLLGGSGQVGTELRALLTARGVVVVAPPRAALDLTDLGRVRDTVRHLAPAAIINAAAHTRVDLAESEPAAAFALNAELPRTLAEEAARAQVPLVHFSTDYVFDGEASGPYRESDPAHPLNVYGASKLAGERAIAATGAMHVILRTSWVYGAHGTNFLRTIRRLLRERNELRIVRDQIGAPTWSRRVAEAAAHVLALAATAARSPLGWADASSGIHHVSAAGETSWYGFAREILALDIVDRPRHAPALIPVRTADVPTPARRPRYSVLDNTRVAATFGIRFPHWRDDLVSVMGEIAARDVRPG